MADRNERWVLNHLIELCRDEEMALRYAADHVTDSATRAVFVNLAQQRAQFVNELQPHAHGLGGAEAAEGTTRGKLHRGWMAFKHRIVSHNDKQMVSAAEQSEQRILATYRDMLTEMIPPRAREVVEQQCAQIAEAQGRLRAMPH
jgi:uncharacterized protein (TIGR02284 family)